jgi:hypothetical protein
MMSYSSFVLNQYIRIFGSSQRCLEVTFIVNYKLCFFCLENTEALLVAINETGLNVNAEEIEYLFAPLEENAGQNYKKKISKNYLKFYDRIQTTLFQTGRKIKAYCVRE